MLKTRAMPLLASAAVALSLTACQGMMGGGESGRQTSQAERSGSQSASQSQAQQALAPDLVRNIQRTLSQRGYDAGPADGVYGESTQSALKNFQRDQKLNGTGQLDSQTLAALGVVQEGSRAATAPAQPQQPYTPTTKRTSRSGTSSNTDLSANQVRDLQRELANRGYDAGQADGRWGPRTQQAVRQFQQDQNLAASGRPDQRTMAALGMEGAGTQTGATPPADEAEQLRQERGGPEGAPEPREETGQLPETEAPGVTTPSERRGLNEGVEPEAPRTDEPLPPEAQPEIR